MGQPIPFQCPVLECKLGSQILHADIFQIKHHLKHGHGYGELQDTALSLGIIRDETERRNPDWLTEKILQHAIKRIKNESTIK